MALRAYSGGYHCGKVRFRVTGDLAQATSTVEVQLFGGQHWDEAIEARTGKKADATRRAFATEFTVRSVSVLTAVRGSGPMTKNGSRYHEHTSGQGSRK